jgi:UDP-GlcNAc:undecaprenyl-phosphate GlcNAc-1-phosphate transferase|tara:strand:- start:4612 stop:5601 length:990 start_codon:yes stop_codon:yes gene_type:complete
MIINILIYSSISFLLLFLISKISYNLNLVDAPSKRKIHLKPTAYTGGIGLCLIYIIAILLFDFSSGKLNLILSTAFLIGIVGFVDDKHDLNVGGKLSLQIIPIIYLIIIENLSLNHMGNYNYFTLELNSFSIPFTLIAILFLINSFNYFDGLDGVLSFSTISTLGILFFLTTNENIKLFLIIILIPIIFFLFFNFSIFKLPKLFLGDSGSLLLGFILAFTLIYLSIQKEVHPILLAFTVSIFAYEFLSINLIRLKNKKKLFKAGQDHLHHQLFKYTKSIFQTNLFISLANIILFIVGYTSFLLIGPLASLILFIVFFIIFLILRNKYSN